MLSHRKGTGALLLAALTLAVITAPRQTNAQQDYIKKVDNWINWNGKFKPGVDSIQSQAVIDDVTSQIAAFSKKPVVDFYRKRGKITQYLRKYAGSNKKRIYITRMTVQKCNNGDSSFWNVNADAEIRGLDSVGSQTGSTPPQPKVVPKGGFLEFFALNSKLQLHRDSLVKATSPAMLLSFPQPVNIDNNAVIAVLDTGIDTTLFAEGIRSDLLWNGTSGSINMVHGRAANNYMDDYINKHGTAVASIALNSFYRASNNTALPKLMVVKVLDENAEGTVFDLCCGINYAVKNHATVINASVGYTLEGTNELKDEAMEYYLAKCQADSIPLVAAAGNTNDYRNTGMLCENNTSGSNRMTLSNMTLPAAYAMNANEYPVISVTGMGKPGIPCYYQYFSPKMVTVGVLNQDAETNCCSFKLPFFIRIVEGTSYATPVVSGRLALSISRSGHRAVLGEYIRQLNALNAPGVTQVTQGNQYITY
jgi:subtilisin family serine protease